MRKHLLTTKEWIMIAISGLVSLLVNCVTNGVKNQMTSPVHGWQVIIGYIAFGAFLFTIFKAYFRGKLADEIEKIKTIIIPNIQIIEAKYGHKDAKFIDVKNLLLEQFKAGHYNLIVSAHLFQCEGQENDPAWGIRKTFYIRYRLGDQEKTFTGQDNEKIVLY